MVRVEAQPLTADAWAPFGWLPVADTDPADGAHTLRFEWADPHLNVIAHTYDEVEHTDARRGVRGDVPARHAHAGAHAAQRRRRRGGRPGTRSTSPTRRTSTHVARLPAHPQDTLVLAPGHLALGPVPARPEPVQLLNVQGLRYAEDNDSVDLAGRTGAVLEVT